MSIFQNLIDNLSEKIDSQKQHGLVESKSIIVYKDCKSKSLECVFILKLMSHKTLKKSKFISVIHVTYSPDRISYMCLTKIGYFDFQQFTQAEFHLSITGIP
jgi:hypothetical protein